LARSRHMLKKTTTTNNIRSPLSIKLRSSPARQSVLVSACFRQRMAKLIYFQLVLFIVCQRSSSQEKSPANIVFILADDLGWNDVGFHGSEIATPNIDRLAEEGVILDNYYVQPMCTPTRGALLTGKYPIHTGLQHYVIAGSEPYGLPLTETTMAQHLKALGYSTHIVGKWHLGFYQKECLPENRGFDSHLGYYLGVGDYLKHTSVDGGYSGYDFHKNGQALWNQTDIYSTEIFTDQANKIIREHDQSKPLFLYLAHQAVHAGNEDDPIQAPQRYVDRFPNIKDPQRRKFAGVASALDDSVGAVYQALEESGMLNNTLIIFSTDNGGPSNGDEDNPASNWPLRGTKMTVWQGGVRGAAFVHSPLLNKQGYVNSNLMHVVDWLPTIYNLAGGNLTNLPNIDGLDQWDVLSNNAATNRQEVLVNIDPVFKNEAIIVGDYKIVSGVVPGHDRSGWYPPPDVSQGSGYLSVDCGQQVSSRQVLVNCGPKPENVTENCQPDKSICLFNIKDDPCEYNNLAALLPSVVAKLQERIDFYKQTMVLPGNKPIDPAGNPALHNGVWEPWL
jgi:arylsulfatase A-like enzyme